eukprot:GHVL01007098.1.p1 GENE.GHVL01007098.1~~GHVL01007098.1.p1  ORF type:complete len:535 (+),score=61.86 GHVL01007098.1:48-1652(+)
MLTNMRVDEIADRIIGSPDKETGTLYTKLIKRATIDGEEQISAVEAIKKVVYYYIRALELKYSSHKIKNASEKWVFERFDEYINLLLSLARNSEIQNFAVTELFKTLQLQNEISPVSKMEYFPVQLFYRLIVYFMSKKMFSGAVGDCIWANHVSSYVDLGTECCRCVSLLCLDFSKENEHFDRSSLKFIRGQKQRPALIENCLKVMLQMSLPDDNCECYVASELGQVYKEQYRICYSEAWTSLMTLRLPSLESYQTALQAAPTRVLPFMDNPLVLGDFFINAFEYGEISVSVSALSGLFYLMTKGNLGEKSLPSSSFYPRLYTLICPKLFSVKNRETFLRLLNASLRSNMVPSTFLGFAIKRLMRVACLVHWTSAHLIMGIVYGLFQKHQEVLEFLVHLPPATSPIIKDGDPYNWHISEKQVKDSIEDADKTEQVPLCLWELQLLERHYNPRTAQLAKLFRDGFKQSPNSPLVMASGSFALSEGTEVIEKILAKNKKKIEKKLLSSCTAAYYNSEDSERTVVEDLWLSAISIPV